MYNSTLHKNVNIARTLLDRGYIPYPYRAGEKRPYFNKLRQTSYLNDIKNNLKEFNKNVNIGVWCDKSLFALDYDLNLEIFLRHFEHDVTSAFEAYEEKIYDIINISKVKKSRKKGVTAFFKYTGKMLDKTSKIGHISAFDYIYCGRMGTVIPPSIANGVPYIWHEDTLFNTYLDELPDFDPSYFEEILQLNQELSNEVFKVEDKKTKRISSKSKYKPILVPNNTEMIVYNTGPEVELKGFKVKNIKFGELIGSQKYIGCYANFADSRAKKGIVNKDNLYHFGKGGITYKYKDDSLISKIISQKKGFDKSLSVIAKAKGEQEIALKWLVNKYRIVLYEREFKHFSSEINKLLRDTQKNVDNVIEDIYAPLKPDLILERENGLFNYQATNDGSDWVNIAPQGSGKTQSFMKGIADNNTIIIVHRAELAKQITRNLEAVHYNSVKKKGAEKIKRLVTCINSLDNAEIVRAILESNFKTIIIDEAGQLLDQLCSFGLAEVSEHAKEVFYMLLRESGRVICADADFSSHHRKVIESITCRKMKVVSVNNSKTKTFIIKKGGVKNAIERYKELKNAVIACESKNTAVVLSNELGINLIANHFVTSEYNIKHGTNIETVLKNKQVVYTTKVGTGVSINREEIKTCILLTNFNFLAPHDLLQLINRFREVDNVEIFYNSIRCTCSFDTLRNQSIKFHSIQQFLKRTSSIKAMTSLAGFSYLARKKGHKVAYRECKKIKDDDNSEYFDNELHKMYEIWLNVQPLEFENKEKTRVELIAESKNNFNAHSFIKCEINNETIIKAHLKHENEAYKYSLALGIPWLKNALQSLFRAFKVKTEDVEEFGGVCNDNFNDACRLLTKQDFAKKLTNKKMGFAVLRNIQIRTIVNRNAVKLLYKFPIFGVLHAKKVEKWEHLEISKRSYTDFKRYKTKYNDFLEIVKEFDIVKFYAEMYKIASLKDADCVQMFDFYRFLCYYSLNFDDSEVINMVEW